MCSEVQPCSDVWYFFSGATRPDLIRIFSAYASGGYTLKEIGDDFGLHYSYVSKIVCLAEQMRRQEKRKT